MEEIQVSIQSDSSSELDFDHLRNVSIAISARKQFNPSIIKVDDT